LADFTGWRLQIAVLQKVVVKTKPKETDILLALAVLDANFDLNKMANILCLTRAEKKLFYHLQNHRKILQNLDQSNIVCQLILVALNIKGDYLQKLLLFLWAENILSDADYENFLAKSKVWQQKTLPISVEDLINIGVSKQHLSQSLQQLKTNMLEALNLHFEAKGKTFTEADLKITLDLPQFFEFYKVINAKALSERIGMNQSLLAQYIKGIKKPSSNQTLKILHGVQQIGNELAAIRFLL
jgi:hypothetical protein